jgi:hypothetical protein
LHSISIEKLFTIALIHAGIYQKPAIVEHCSTFFSCWSDQYFRNTEATSAGRQAKAVTQSHQNTANTIPLSSCSIPFD